MTIKVSAEKLSATWKSTIKNYTKEEMSSMENIMGYYWNK